MPHYGTLHDHKIEDADDLRGADVYGVNDEKLGTIDDVIFDHSSGDIRYIVLKTGGLLSRKRVMIPANRIDTYGNHEDKFYAKLDKERLEMLPEFHDQTLNTESDWNKFENDYEKRWNDGAVMHNKDSGEVMNPIGEELEFQREEPGNRSEAIPAEPVVVSETVVVETEQGAGPVDRENVNQGRRWNDFQQKLRSRRDKIVVDCPHCASQDKAA